MFDQDFVFQDKEGKRWPRLRKVLLLAGFALFVGGVFFVESILTPADMVVPNTLQDLKKQLRSLQKANASVQAAAADMTLRKHLAAAGAKKPGFASRPLAVRSGEEVRAAFYVGWDENSMASLRKHFASLTHVCPEWLRLNLQGGIEEEEDADIDQLDDFRSLVLMPIITNLSSNDRQPEAVESLALGSREAQDRFIVDLIARLQKARAGGVVIDWEEMDPSYRHELTGLVDRIARRLHEAGLRTWLCIPMGDEIETFDLDALSSSVDHFVAMLHDENSATDAPGPVASQDWFDGWLKVLMGCAPPDRWIASIGNYGYDWREGKALAETISFANAMSRADNAGESGLTVGQPEYNPSFSYYAGGENHEVWFLDASTFLNQLGAVRDYGLAGFALQRLGTEDPKVWNAIPVAGVADRLAQALPSMERLDGAEVITSIGDGEIVTIDNSKGDGIRRLEIDGSGRVSCSYLAFPSYPTLFRQGAGDKHTVALTFDDGPDAEWTPRILDILKERGVKATFFLVGKEIENQPDLARRILDEGHEIGNHTFTHANLAAVSSAQTRIELNATQRLIESLTGRSTTLFRPPYNADSAPSDVAELVPIEIAQELNYLTVLENIDTEDWQRPGAGVILQRVKDRRADGNIVLMHDGGGNRAQTVEALPRILDYLQERGDHVVPLSELLGMPRDKVMPLLSPEQHNAARLATSVGFRMLRIGQEFLRTFLVLATVLVVLRTFVVLILSLSARRRRNSGGIIPFAPPLSVIIPAFNEAKVIGNTIRSVLDTEYAGLIEVVVVDDGSKDDTAERARAVGDPRVRVIVQPNQGKAAALQNAMSRSSHEHLVFIDADTQFEPQTLGKLVEPFADDRVGAVSGHARVGNLRRFIGRCQDIEYICGFNLDRRAYAAWNCITVVPGAISAFRKSAILEAGGFSHDTLAEDTDLTLSVHRVGYRVEYEPKAIAFTEAPETISALTKQRFRWAYGTLQCVWKHRDLVFNPRFKALGWFSLPSIWFFQVILVAFSPFIDLLFFESILLGEGLAVLPYFLAFLATDLVIAGVAVSIEKMPIRAALTVIPQRFLYRPLLSYVIWKALFHAVRGAWVGWGKLQRTASVSVRS